MKRLLYIFMFLPFIALGQTTTENYVKTIVYKDDTGNINAANVTVTYLDGLGRPIQQIAGKQSGKGNKDLITHIEYDAYGRQTKEYLPYAATTDNLAFDPDAQANTVDFYNTSTFEDTSNPYSEQFLEASPLSRVLKQGAPGTPWLGNANDDNDHTIKFAYLTNEANEVLKFSATATWAGDTGNLIYNTTFVNSGQYYAANELYKTITQNENKASAVYTGTSIASKLNTVEEFKNKEGQLILKRTYNQEHGQPVVALDTYYVYDQYGNLTYVLPPKRGNGTSIDLDKYCYQYKYDSRNRLVEKKLPGRDNWEFIVYDKLDRVVATGPVINPWGGLETNTGWLIIQYDAFGRVAYTGWFAATGINTDSRRIMQSRTWAITAKTTSSVLINTISVYYTNTLPTNLQSGFKLLTVNYYDNYVYPNAPAVPTSSTQLDGQDVLVNCTGLQTGSWMRALTAQSDTYGDLSYTYYDEKGRPIRNVTTNYLGGFTQVDSKLDFDGTLQYTNTTHRRTGNTSDQIFSTQDTYAYTPQDRLFSHTNTITGQPAELLLENNYDAIGQLTGKKVGNTSSSPLQKVDFTYNIRGWLKGINVPGAPVGLPGPGADPALSNDLFVFEINYNGSIAQNISGSVVPLYNGNIAETSWRTASDDIQRRYGYTYDNLNRLTDAWYQIPQATVPVRNSYNEHLTYDANGNITSLQRNGEQDSATLVEEIDDLSYDYDGNRLTEVLDESSNPKGFNDQNATGADYFYDAFGNIRQDKNKGINTDITYNHLNLPVTIVINDGTNIGTITYLYNAAGVKLQKKVTNSAVSPASVTTTDYFSGGYQYQNNVLEFFPTSEGYVKHTIVSNTSRYSYVYQYKDHLGNNRITYTKDPTDGLVKILEEDHYYPFGLKHEGYSADQQMIRRVEDVLAIVPVINPADATYKYMYNGKELQNELGLNNYDFGARNYDPAIGRWMNIDPKAEVSRRWTPYNYAYNNPIYFVDPDGMQADDWVQIGEKEVIYDKDVTTSEQAKTKYGPNASILKDNTRIVPVNSYAYSYTLKGDGTVVETVENTNVDISDGFTTPGGVKISTAKDNVTPEVANEIDPEVNKALNDTNSAASTAAISAGIFEAASSDSGKAISTASKEALATAKISRIAGNVSLAANVVQLGTAVAKFVINPTAGSLTRIAVQGSIMGIEAGANALLPGLGIFVGAGLNSLEAAFGDDFYDWIDGKKR